MDGQEPQNNSGGASAARLGPGHGNHGAAAVARPRPGRGTASGAGSGWTDSPRRGSYRRGDATADRRSDVGLRTGAAAPPRQPGTRRPLDRRAPAGAAPDVPHTPGAVRHGACRGGPDVRGAADDSLPGDGHGHQPGDQGPAGQRDPHRRAAGPADRGARRTGPRGRSGQAPVPGQRGPLFTLPAPGSDQARPDGRARGARRDGRAERGRRAAASGTGHGGCGRQWPCRRRFGAQVDLRPSLGGVRRGSRAARAPGGRDGPCGGLVGGFAVGVRPLVRPASTLSTSVPWINRSTARYTLRSTDRTAVPMTRFGSRSSTRGGGPARPGRRLGPPPRVRVRASRLARGRPSRRG